SSPSRRTRCVPLPRLQPNSGSPEFGHLLTGRSRINPTSAGGTGRGHTTRFVLPTPSPTLPRQRGRERTEIAGADGIFVTTLQLHTHRTRSPMPKPRAPKLETATARRRLDVRKKPYWTQLSPGIALGYRRNEGAGTWSVRVADGGVE